MSKNTNNMVLKCIERAKKKQQEMDVIRAKYTALRNKYYQQSRQLALKLEDEGEQLSQFTNQTAITVRFGDLLDAIKKFKGENYCAVKSSMNCVTKNRPFYQFSLNSASRFQFVCTIYLQKDDTLADKFMFDCDINSNIVQLNNQKLWAYLESDKTFNTIEEQELAYYTIPDRYRRGVVVDVPVELVVSSPIMEQAVLYLMQKQANKGC